MGKHYVVHWWYKGGGVVGAYGHYAHALNAGW